MVAVVVEPDMVVEVLTSTLYPLEEQVSEKCDKASFLSSSSHFFEINLCILSPFLTQMVFKSAGFGSSPTTESKQAGG